MIIAGVGEHIPEQDRTKDEQKEDPAQCPVDGVAVRHRCGGGGAPTTRRQYRQARHIRSVSFIPKVRFIASKFYTFKYKCEYTVITFRIYM